MSEFTDSNKERFTETEVKDWINGIVAEKRKTVEIMHAYLQHRGVKAIQSGVENEVHDIEILEYIRDNYLPGEIRCSGCGRTYEERKNK